MCCCSCFLYYSYMVDGFGIYSLFFLLLYCCLCICEEQTNAPKLNVNMRWKRIMCIQRKTEKTNRLKRMRYLYYIYMCKLWQSLRFYGYSNFAEKKTKIVGDFRFETWFTSSYNLDAILMSFHYSMNIFGVMNVFNFGWQVQCHGFQLCFSTHKISW